MVKINNFLESRNSHSHENTEDYLELINDLLNDIGEARIVDIAKQLNIAQATTNKTIQRLQKQGYVEKLPYRSIFLTPKGQDIAYGSKKRHNIVYNLMRFGMSIIHCKMDTIDMVNHTL